MKIRTALSAWEFNLPQVSKAIEGLVSEPRFMANSPSMVKNCAAFTQIPSAKAIHPMRMPEQYPEHMVLWI